MIGLLPFDHRKSFDDVAFALTVVVLVTSLRIALANEYEIFVNITDEEDLHSLVDTGQISERTFDALLNLFIMALISTPQSETISTRYQT